MIDPVLRVRDKKDNDLEYYRSLTPAQRVDLVELLRRRIYEQKGEPFPEGIEPVLTVREMKKILNEGYKMRYCYDFLLPDTGA